MFCNFNIPLYGVSGALFIIRILSCTVGCGTTAAAGDGLGAGGRGGG